jgi:predicted PurR-regulated permease PerM
LGLGALALAVAPVLALLFFAIVLAAAIEPFTDRLREHLPTGRAGTVLVAYGATLVVLVLGVILLVPSMVREAQGVLAALPVTLAEVRVWADDLEPDVASRAVVALTESAEQILERAQLPPIGDVVEAGSTAAAIVGSVVTVLALAFFWLLERPRLQRYVLAFMAADRRAGMRDAWNTVEARLGAWARVQVILMTAIGVASAVAYLALGLPSAVLLGVIAGLAELIPIVGPLVGAIPAVVVAATLSPEHALAVVAISVGLQAVEGLVLVPVVTRNNVGLSPMLVFISVLLGSAIGGIVGALVAVPVAAVLEILLERFQARDEPIVVDPASAMAGGRGE